MIRRFIRRLLCTHDSISVHTMWVSGKLKQWVVCDDCGREKSA
jgi:hypothetical protein